MSVSPPVSVVVVPPSSSAWIWVIIVLIIVVLIVAVVVLGAFFRRPIAPIPPNNLAGQVTGATTVRLTWSPPPGFIPLGYAVYADTHPSLNSALVTWVPGTSTSVNLTLENTGCWYFTVASQSTLNGETITGPFRIPFLTLCLPS